MILNKDVLVKKTETNSKDQILNNPDYIQSPRYKNSIKSILEAYPEGLDNKTIARILMMSEEELEKTYQEAIKELQKSLKKGL